LINWQFYPIDQHYKWQIDIQPSLIMPTNIMFPKTFFLFNSHSLLLMDSFEIYGVNTCEDPFWLSCCKTNVSCKIKMFAKEKNNVMKSIQFPSNSFWSHIIFNMQFDKCLDFNIAQTNQFETRLTTIVA